MEDLQWERKVPETLDVQETHIFVVVVAVVLFNNWNDAMFSMSLVAK